MWEKAQLYRHRNQLGQDPVPPVVLSSVTVCPSVRLSMKLHYAGPLSLLHCYSLIFLLLGQNTGHTQCKGGRVYSGSWFQRVQFMDDWLQGRNLLTEGSVEESCPTYSRQEAESSPRGSMRGIRYQRLVSTVVSPSSTQKCLSQMHLMSFESVKVSHHICQMPCMVLTHSVPGWG